MKYPQHIFSQMSEKRQLEVIRRFLDRLEEKLGTPSESDLSQEVEFYLSWSITEFTKPSQWSAQAIDQLQCEIDLFLGQTVRDDQLRVLKGDRLISQDKTSSLPLKVVLHNLRSAFNVGAIFRTVECLQAEEVILSGYSPEPTHPSVQKTVMGVLPFVKWRKINSVMDFIKSERSLGRDIVALETVEGAPSIYAWEIDRPVTLILGNERFGIDREVLGECDRVVCIPVAGVKNSLNVSTAFAVTAYEVFRKWQVKNAH